jgi:hypothetical protein
MDKAELIRAATILAESRGLGDEAQAEKLVAAGFGESVAYRVVAFLPSAFARPVIEELGATVTGLASIPAEDGSWFDVVLEDQPEYRAALALAREHRRAAVIPRAVYRAIVEATSEIDAASNALNAGEEIRGGALALELVSNRHAAHVIRPTGDGRA